MRSEDAEWLAEEMPLVRAGDELAAQVLELWNTPFHDIGAQQETKSAEMDPDSKNMKALMMAYGDVTRALVAYETAKQNIIDAKRCNESDEAIAGHVRTVAGAIERIKVSATYFAAKAVIALPEDRLLQDEALSLLQYIGPPVRQGSSVQPPLPPAVENFG